MTQSAREYYEALLDQLKTFEQNIDAQREELAKLRRALRAQAAETTRVSQEQIESQAPWRAALEAVRLGLESERRRTDRLFGWLVRAQSSRENCRYFGPPQSTGSGEQDSSEDQPMIDEDMLLVDLRIFWITSARSPAANADGTSEEKRQHEHIGVLRVTSRGTGKPMPISPIPESADEVVLGTFDASMPKTDSEREQYFQDAFDAYVAKKLVDPAWEKSTEVWVTPVCAGVASVAERLGALQHQWHELILGEPVRSAGRLMLIEPAPADMLAGIATEAPLPGDTVITGIKRLVQITGILIGVASNQPLLVNACLKSLAHDILSEAAREVIGHAIANTLRPAGAQERDLEGSQAGDEIARQTKDMTDRLEAYVDQQKAGKELARGRSEINTENRAEDDIGGFEKSRRSYFAQVPKEPPGIVVEGEEVRDTRGGKDLKKRERFDMNDLET